MFLPAAASADHRRALLAGDAMYLSRDSARIEEAESALLWLNPVLGDVIDVRIIPIKQRRSLPALANEYMLWQL